jgi:hypothetical protein
MHRSQTIWDQNYAQAFTLVQKLYDPETKDRSKLIKSVLNAEILLVVQDILDKDLAKVNIKIDCIIDQAISLQYKDKELIPVDYREKILYKLKELNQTREGEEIDYSDILRKDKRIDLDYLHKRYNNFANQYTETRHKKRK